MSLLEEMEGADTGKSLIDELNEIPDDEDCEPWLPEDVGDGIEGIVTKRYYVTSDHKDVKTGLYPECMVVVVDVGGGDLWKVTGFRQILREEMERCDPQPGDRFAAVYRGGPVDEKTGELKYNVYRCAVRRAAVTSGRAAGNGTAPAAAGNGAATEAPAAKKPRRKPGQPKPAAGAITKGGAAQDDEPPF